MNTKKTLIIVGIICFVFLMYLLDKRQKQIAKWETELFFRNGRFAIGVVIGKNYSSSTLSSIMYSFKNNNIIIKKSLGSVEAKAISSDAWKTWVHHIDSVKKGSKFLVIYDSCSISSSILCLDKPIKDSTDYYIYIKAIENNGGNFVRLRLCLSRFYSNRH